MAEIVSEEASQHHLEADNLSLNILYLFFYYTYSLSFEIDYIRIPNIKIVFCILYT